MVRRDQADRARRELHRAGRHPRQVADALMAHRRVGVDTVLIRGFDPLADVVEWGTELVPLLREQAASMPVGTEAAALPA